MRDTVTKYNCDKCNKAVADSDAFNFIEIIADEVYLPEGNRGRMELCDDCAIEFVKILRGFGDFKEFRNPHNPFVKSLFKED